jgi:hypothetical protein
MMPDDLPDRLTRLAPTVDEDAALSARHRPTGRRVLYVGATLLMVVALLVTGVLFIARDNPQSNKVTAGPDDTPSDTTTSVPLPTALRIDPPLPAGWVRVSGPLYPDISLPGTAPIAEATVATFEVPPVRGRECDTPIAALEGLGADDAFVSVVEARAGSGDPRPRPPETEFLPLDVPLDLAPADQRDLPSGKCLSRAEDFRYNETLFAENGRLLRVFVGLGLNASPGAEDEVLEVIRRIVVEPIPR